MTWFKVDDTLGDHPKVFAAGNAAMGLWVRCGAYAGKQLTDGFVPTHIVLLYGNRAQAKKLVDAGLWMEKDGGYQFHQWDERQPSRGKVESDRELARQRKAAQRAKGQSRG